MTDQQIQALMREFHMPAHVKRHCETVARFAVELGEKIAAAGESVDLELLQKAALLHDLVRIVDFRNFRPENFPDPATREDIAFWNKLRDKYRGRGHEDVAGEILENRGFPEIADVVRSHRYVQILKGFKNWEEKILYYADKRTKHDKIVQLKERLDEGRKRNASETIGTFESKELDEKIYALEKEILTKIGTA